MDAVRRKVEGRTRGVESEAVEQACCVERTVLDGCGDGWGVIRAAMGQRCDVMSSMVLVFAGTMYSPYMYIPVWAVETLWSCQCWRCVLSGDVARDRIGGPQLLSAVRVGRRAIRRHPLVASILIPHRQGSGWHHLSTLLQVRAGQC